MPYKYEGQIAETVTFIGHNGDSVEAYAARPVGVGSFGGVVVVHHNPGWDEWTKEVVRKFAYHGYAAISSHLYCRLGDGAPDDLAAKGRAAGGVPDDQVVEDNVAAAGWLRNLAQSNGKVGIIGFCSGGRNAFLCACRAPDVFDAVVDCWGGNVVVDRADQLSDKRPVAPLDFTASLKAPLLGLFGNDDKNPTPAHVNRLEEELKKHKKTYDFHRYDDAGHAFFNTTRDAYRVNQAMDGWAKIFDFYGRHLGQA